MRTSFIDSFRPLTVGSKPYEDGSNKLPDVGLTQSCEATKCILVEIGNLWSRLGRGFLH